MGANWKAFTKVDKGRFGYGQVEPTHMSFQRSRQIYAQLPAADSIDQLENGEFVKYDYANEEVNKTGKGEWMMVYNEIKLYDEREQMYKDYAMVKSAFTPGSTTIKHNGLGAFAGQMVPRVVKTNVGDIMITNTLKSAAKDNYAATTTEDELDTATKYLKVNAAGFLEKCEESDIDTEDMVWQIDHKKAFTMPDGQPAVKIQRIK